MKTKIENNMKPHKIAWTEKTWNPVTGCNKISAGCKNCYAEGIANRFWKDRKFTDVQCHPERLNQPLSWKKPSMIFVNSMSDLFHEKVPFEFVDRVWETMFASERHTYQILTKRPARMLEYFQYSLELCKRNSGKEDIYEIPLPNVWLGVSIENQKAADERIPLLLQTPAAIRFLSIEPMLEEINLESYLCPKVIGYSENNNTTTEAEISWIILGSESGSKRRPCKIEWVESIVEQCKQANVPVFVKQISIKNEVVKDINLFPENLRIREYPRAR